MAIQAGLVGLPNVGKSTLFNALTKSSIPAENYPFCTVDPHTAITYVPDERLGKLAAIFKSQKLIPTTVQFVDIAGLVKGAAEGEGLGNQFLSHIMEVDLVLHVLRCFDDPNILHVHNKVSPLDDFEVIVAELMLKDLDAVAKREERVQSFIKSATDMMSSLGITERGLNNIIASAYSHLGLITFFTCGPKEAHAWSIKRNTPVPRAAGEIHSDLERGFICAEVYSCHDLFAAGSEAQLKATGKLRTEGKEYIVQDGDLLNIKFNV
ncbi:YchF family ATPase [bacterium]|nr:YchF family ATPase [bacterium]